MSVNLLSETIEMMSLNGKKPEDVDWIGSRDGEFAMCWQDFRRISNIEYDNGFGAQEVASDLVVVFCDSSSWMERVEYDGSECWRYKSIPKVGETHKIPTKLIGGMLSKISDLTTKEE